jgi:hypothetical protein
MRTFWRHLLTPEIQEGIDAENGPEIVWGRLTGHACAPFNRRGVETNRAWQLAACAVTELQ